MQINFISSPYAKYYLAPMFSQAQCFCLINYLIIIILPFLFFFSSKGNFQYLLSLKIFGKTLGSISNNHKYYINKKL